MKCVVVFQRCQFSANLLSISNNRCGLGGGPDCSTMLVWLGLLRLKRPPQQRPARRRSLSTNGTRVSNTGYPSNPYPFLTMQRANHQGGQRSRSIKIDSFRSSSAKNEIEATGKGTAPQENGDDLILQHKDSASVSNYKQFLNDLRWRPSV